MGVLLTRGLHKPLGSSEAFLFLVQAFQLPLFQSVIFQLRLVSGPNLCMFLFGEAILQSLGLLFSGSSLGSSCLDFFHPVTCCPTFPNWTCSDHVWFWLGLPLPKQHCWSQWHLPLPWLWLFSLLLLAFSKCWAFPHPNLF